MNLWMKSYGVTIQMKPAEHFFAVVLFTMLYKVNLTFEPFKWKRYRALLWRGAVYYDEQGGFNFWVCEWNCVVLPFKLHLFNCTFARFQMSLSIIYNV